MILGNRGADEIIDRSEKVILVAVEAQETRGAKPESSQIPMLFFAATLEVGRLDRTTGKLLPMVNVNKGRNIPHETDYGDRRNL